MTDDAAPLTVGALVMAAGRSSRMGANKLLADLGGRPVIAHVVDAVRDAGWPAPIVVTGHDAMAVERALAGRPAHFVSAPDHADGLSRSILAGIAAIPADWDAVAICLGDMPLVRPETLRLLARHASRDAVLIPRHGGRRGNPALWGRSHLERLGGIEGDKGGSALFAALGEALVELECDDEGVLIDVDTPARLAQARAAFDKRTRP